MLKITLDSSGSRDAELDRVLADSNDGLMYYGPNFRRFLTQVLPNSECMYLYATEGKDLVGLFPCFAKREASTGVVINSLPFFGSHGGPWLAPRCKSSGAVEQLVHAFLETVRSLSAVAATVVENPFRRDEMPLA